MDQSTFGATSSLAADLALAEEVSFLFGFGPKRPASDSTAGGGVHASSKSFLSLLGIFMFLAASPERHWLHNEIRDIWIPSTGFLGGGIGGRC